MRRLSFKILLGPVFLSFFTLILLMTYDPAWKTWVAPWASAASGILLQEYYRRLSTKPEVSRPNLGALLRISGGLSAAVAGISTLLVPFKNQSAVWYRPTLIVAGVLLIIGALLVLSSPLIIKPAPDLAGRNPD